MVPVDTTNTDQSLDTYSKMFSLKDKDISITEFNKYINSFYKEAGFEESRAVFNNFLLENDDKLKAKDALRLASNFINILKKEKLTKDDLLIFFNSCSAKYNFKNDEDLIIDVSKVYKKISLESAIDFLDGKTNDLEKNKEKRRDFLDVIILQSEYLLKLNRFEDSFQNLAKSETIIPFLDNFDRISFSQKIAKLRSDICLKDKKPKYDSYLFYDFCSFLFTITQRLIAFPHFSAFCHSKENGPKDGWPYEKNNDFETALLNLNMSSSKNTIIKELNNYAYEELPKLYGIPTKYDSDEKVNHILENIDDYESWKELSQFSDKLKSKSIESIAIGIMMFSQNLFQQEYDKNNTRT